MTELTEISILTCTMKFNQKLKQLEVRGRFLRYRPAYGSYITRSYRE